MFDSVSARAGVWRSVSAVPAEGVRAAVRAVASAVAILQYGVRAVGGALATVAVESPVSFERVGA